MATSLQRDWYAGHGFIFRIFDLSWPNLGRYSFIQFREESFQVVVFDRLNLAVLPAW